MEGSHVPNIAGVDDAYAPTFVGKAPMRRASPRREKFIGFVKDQPSATVLHGALQGAFSGGAQIHIVDFRTSLTILAGMMTPEVVLVDVSGEEQPINAMLDLADVVEPGTLVLAVGETQNVNFYRTVTKGMGVREYLPKPLTAAQVERNFLMLLKTGLAGEPVRGGRMVAVSGTKGGIGTSTIAVNLAWMIGVELHRHTVLLDADLYNGTAALSLNVKHNSGLCTALESPERIDQLLIERATQAAGERLHVLAAMESYTRPMTYQPGAAAMLSQALRARYNFVVVDAGSRPTQFAWDLLHIAHQRLVVVEPSLASIRNLERIIAMPAGPLQSPRVATVLVEAPGGLSLSYMEQALGLRFDAVIPDLPKVVQKATQFGRPAVAARGTYRNAITKLANALGANALGEAVNAA